MKTKRCIAILLGTLCVAMLLCLLPASASADTSGQCGPDLHWSFNEATGILTIAGSGAMYDYNMGYDNAPWASIRAQITQLVLPEGLTYIGHMAFYKCTGLTTLTIPEGVITIGNSAFSGCSQLANITLASTVTDIYMSSFYDTAFWNDQPDGLVYFDHVLLGVKTAYDYPDGTLSVAPGTRVIAQDSFGITESIRTLLLPEGLTNIGAEAFCNCNNLTSISLPSTIRSIGESAFYCGTHDQSSHVYYNGTKAMRQEIAIASNNLLLTLSTWHYSLIDVDEANFPDDAFRSWIIAHLPVGGSQAEGYTMTAAQINSVTAIDCSGQDIADLTGIGEFMKLESLDCSDNRLVSLNLYSNPKLKTLHCNKNALVSLDISSCKDMELLDLSDNPFNANTSGPDFYDLSKLKTLNCSRAGGLADVRITSPFIERIDCSNTSNLQHVNIYVASALQYLDCSNDPYLHTLEFSYAQPQLTYLNCANSCLSKLDLSGLPALATLNCSHNALPSLDVSQNPKLQTLLCNGQTLPSVEMSHGRQGYLFNLATLTGDPSKVTMSTAGADYTPATGRLCFRTQPVSFAYLYAVSGQQMDVTVPVSGSAERYLEIDAATFPDDAFRKYIGSYLSTSGDDVIGRYMDQYQAAAVTNISCPGQGIRSVKGIERFTQLQTLDVGYAEENNTVTYNQIASLNLSANTKLTKLNCSANPLTALTISSRLQSLNCSFCPLNTLDLSGLTTLASLQCRGCQLTSLNVSALTKLAVLDCSDNRLSSLNLNGNTALEVLLCDGNQLSRLNVSKNTMLYQLSCSENALTALDIGALHALLYLDCSGNSISSLNVSSNKILQYLICGGNQLASLNLAKNADLTHLAVQSNRLTSLNVASNPHLSVLACGDNQLKELSLAKNTALSTLSCRGNQLKKLVLAANRRLTELDCSENQLETLDVFSCESMITLLCAGNALTQLRLPDGTLYTLDCSGNRLEALDLSHTHAIQKLYCAGNRIAALDLSGNTSIAVLDCSGNRIAALDLTGFQSLTDLNCGGNRLSSLDLSQLRALKTVQCAGQVTARHQLTKTETGYAFNLSPLVPDTARVTVTTAGAAYDPATGLVTLKKSIDSLSYTYATGFGTVAMDVSVPFLGGPVIQKHPQDVTVRAGEEATFSVTASGASLSYQWFTRKGTTAWSRVPDGTKATLRIVAASDMNGSQYYCLVSNADGQAASDPATLTVLADPPTIKDQPKDAKVKSGGKAKFTVKAKEKDVTFQWYSRASEKGEWQEMKGEAKATLTLAATGANNGWQYRCRVRNKAGGEVYSRAATLTVILQKPVIKAQPKSLSVKSGKKAKFTVKASGKNITYQWFTRADANGEWEPVAGANKASCEVVASKATNGSQYYCYLKNADGDATSATVTLTVATEKPVIKTQPKSLTVKSGKKAKFTVKASGKNLTYTWYSRPNAEGEWTPVAGQTKNSLSIVASKANNGTQYCCKVKNLDGEADSAVVTLTVTPEAPTIKTQPKDAKVKIGGKAKFKVKASGKNVTYQWYYRTSETGEWVLIDGATKATYEVIAKETNIGWQFRCLAKNADGQVYSKPATLLKK